MENDHDDSDIAFFGVSPGTSDLPFPFGPTPEPGYEPDDSSNDGSDSPTAYDSNEYGVIRYGRFDGEDDEGTAEDFRDSIPWQGGPIRFIRGADEQRAIEAADTGDRHVGRVADARAGLDTQGATGGSATRVADSIRDAGERIRRSNGATLSSNAKPDELRGINVTDPSTVKRQYERSTIVAPPTFRRAEFESTLTGLKANVNGDWIITFKVSPQYDEAVMSLKNSYGLALKQSIERRTHEH